MLIGMGRVFRRCNWCGDNNSVLYKDKPYCTDCANHLEKECSACHKPYPDLKYFKLSLHHCNSCQKKMDKSKIKKEMEKRGEEDLPRRKKGSQKRVVSYADVECGVAPSEDEEDTEYYECGLQSAPTQQQQQQEYEDEDSAIDVSLPPKKRKSRNMITSSSSEDDVDEQAMKVIKKKKKSGAPAETLLKYLNVEGKKQLTETEIQKKKKRKYNRKHASTDDHRDIEAWEDLVRALGNYKKTNPTKTSIQLFLLK